MEAAAIAKETASNLKRKKFRWDNDLVQHLINSLLEYKRPMTYLSNCANSNSNIIDNHANRGGVFQIIESNGNLFPSIQRYMALILRQELQNLLLACGSFFSKYHLV